MARDTQAARDLSSALIEMLNNPGDSMTRQHAVHVLQKYGYSAKIRSDEYFTEQADMHGIDPAWFGVEVTSVPVELNGKMVVGRYKVVGIDPTRPKNKIMLETKKGSIQYASIEWLCERMGVVAEGPEAPTRTRDIQL